MKARKRDGSKRVLQRAKKIEQKKPLGKIQWQPFNITKGIDTASTG